MSWQEAHDAARVQRDETPRQKRYRLACQKRRDDLRAQGLCIFCGRAPGAPYAASVGSARASGRV